MDFDIEQAKNLAKLSRLEFSDKELKEFLKEFDAILEQVSLIDKYDVSGVDIRGDTKLDVDGLRKDVVVDTFSQEQVLANAPEKKDGAFLVPLTVE